MLWHWLNSGYDFLHSGSEAKSYPQLKLTIAVLLEIFLHFTQTHWDFERLLNRNKKSYKSKQKIKNNPSEWVIFENTHEAIIDQDTYDIVQRIRDGRRRPTPLGTMPVLSGMLFCADCGAKMYQVRGKDWPTSKEHLVCATYRKINKPAVRALNYYLYKNFRYSTHTGI